MYSEVGVPSGELHVQHLLIDFFLWPRCRVFTHEESPSRADWYTSRSDGRVTF